MFSRLFRSVSCNWRRSASVGTLVHTLCMRNEPMSFSMWQVNFGASGVSAAAAPGTTTFCLDESSGSAVAAEAAGAGWGASAAYAA